jgi:hypothetical protein
MNLLTEIVEAINERHKYALDMGVSNYFELFNQNLPSAAEILGNYQIPEFTGAWGISTLPISLAIKDIHRYLKEYWDIHTETVEDGFNCGSTKITYNLYHENCGTWYDPDDNSINMSLQPGQTHFDDYELLLFWHEHGHFIDFANGKLFSQPVCNWEFTPIWMEQNCIREYAINIDRTQFFKKEYAISYIDVLLSTAGIITESELTQFLEEYNRVWESDVTLDDLGVITLGQYGAIHWGYQYCRQLANHIKQKLAA